MMELEKQCDVVVKEKQRVQSLLESVQRRADDLERTLEITNQKVEELKDIEHKMNDIKSKCTDLESKIAVLEKEKDIAQRDTHRYKEIIEVSNRTNLKSYLIYTLDLVDDTFYHI